MQNIRSGIIKYLILIAAAIMVIMLSVFIVLQVWGHRHTAREDAGLMFSQIEQVLDENSKELETLRQEYNDTCLRAAEAAAYLLQYKASKNYNTEELRSIARLVKVDELHIFDETGTIIAGTHPEYFGYSFDSGEQMGFFKPLLSDKSLRLCQDMTPNTAEGKMMQYSALWSPNGEFIVEVGIEPMNVMRIAEKNRLSYIFKLLRAGAGISLYAIDTESHTVRGSTDSDDTGKSMEEIGFLSSDIKDGIHARTLKINGVKSYCIFKIIDRNLIAYVVPNRQMYKNVPQDLIIFALALMLIAFILVTAVTNYMQRHVINSIHNINDTLTEISEGNLDKNVNINGNVEFTELSSHINDMIRSLLASTDKMSYILKHLNSRIGVYEYNKKMRGVRFTDYIPEILGIDDREAKRLKSDHRLFEQYINNLCESPLPDEPSIYSRGGDSEQYIKIDETRSGNDVFGVIIDMTNEILTRRRIETERDIDILTGLLNRRGINARFEQMFGGGERLGYGAMIMLDADDLKFVNDTYGHSKGDSYLIRIAELVSGFGLRKNLSSRLSGDEFAVLLYGYESEAELDKDIDEFMKLQDGKIMRLGDNISVQIRFSAGYSRIYGQTNYHMLLRSADEMMYANKRDRKNKKTT